jgi:hypothetical protein
MKAELTRHQQVEVITASGFGFRRFSICCHVLASGRRTKTPDASIN